MRIWIEGQANRTIPQDAQFYLITTAVCSDGTAAAYLCQKSRNDKKAMRCLNTTASTSTNVANAVAYRAFKSLNEQDQELLVKAITVFDGAPSIDHLDDQLRQAVFYAVERKFLDSYLQRIEGWWYRRVVKHLLDNNTALILGEELEAEASRIREQLKDENLPIDDDIMLATIDASGYQGRMFVEQLNLIGVNSERVVHAIRNYYRAFEQRSRWIRENLLYVGDLERYENRLIEEWDLMFQQMRDDLGEDATNEAKIDAAQRLYKWVETNTHHVIRPAVTEPAIARGTYQMMGDDLRVGWHPEFGKRLEALLSGTAIS